MFGALLAVAYVLLAQPPLHAAASISASPSSIDFGSQPVGTSGLAQSVTITNTGTTDLFLNSIFNSGSHIHDFLAGDGCVSITLPAGASCAISVWFAPSAPGARGTILTLTTNVPGVIATVALSGAGTGGNAVLAVAPTALEFGRLRVGEASGEQTVTLTSTGDAAVNVTGIAMEGAGAGSFRLTAAGGGTLVPGASLTVRLVFAPASSGPQSALLVVRSSAAGSPHTVALSGLGANPSPAARLSDSSLSFGSRAVGTTSDEQSVSLTNTGAVPLFVSGTALEGSEAGSFSVTAGGESGTLPPGASRTVRLTFTPREPGRHSARLLIASDAPGSPHSVNLSGSGTQPPPPPRGASRLIINPPSLQFGDQPVGRTSSPQSVALMNTGTAPLVIRSVTVAGANRADFIVSAGESGITVAEGASRIVSVVFTPSGSGKRTARLMVTDNAAGSPNEVPLEGNGVVPPLSAGDWPVFRHDSRQLGLAGAALDPRPLQPWSFPLDGRSGGVVVRDEVAYAGTQTGSLYAVQIRTRAERWRRTLAGPIRSTPAVGPHGVIVSAGGLHCLDAGTGSIRWQRSDVVTEPEVSPMLVGEVVYVAAPAAGAEAHSTRNWAVHAIDVRSGRNAWPAPAPLPEGYDVRVTVAAYPEIGLLFVCMRSGNPQPPSGVPAGAVLALRLADGGRAWAAPAPLPSPAPPGGIVVGWVTRTPSLPVLQPAVFVTAGGGLTALHALSGTQLWTRTLPETTLPGMPSLSTAAPQGATLYIGGASGRLYALDTTTGADASGRLPEAGGSITGPLTLAGPFLFVPISAGPVAVDVRSGTRVWSQPLGATESLVIAGDSLFATTTDGRLVLYGH